MPFLAAKQFIDLRGAKASQSSTLWGADARRAIDGNSNSNYHQNSCTHTNADNGPWWQVAFSQEQSIGAIQIMNRGDCCGQRLSGFDVLVDGVKCASNVPIAQGQMKTVPCLARGKAVKVRVPRKGHLTICEIRIVKGRGIYPPSRRSLRSAAFRLGSTPSLRCPHCAHYH